MFDIENLDNETIAYYWQRAELCAESVWLAYCTKKNIGQAELDQRWLRQWIKEARKARLVYNGKYDKYLNIKL